LGQNGSINPRSAGYCTTRSISARSLARRVVSAWR
jgi:hypothetical protein